MLLTLALAASLQAAPAPPAASGALALSLADLDLPPARPESTPDGARAFGRGWKAEFSSDGLSLLPALGPEAPRNLPLNLQLVSLHRGQQRFEPGLGSMPEVGSQRVAYPRAGGVLERYEVRVEGLELALDFEHELGAAGDLVARYLVDTELVGGAFGQGLEELSFTSAHGGVHVGGVTGIDAGGETAAGHLAFDGTYLDLVLPAVFVDSAAWPLTLDPLLGPDSPFGSGNYDIASVTAATSPDDGELMTYVAVTSAIDTDIRGLHRDAGGTATWLSFASDPAIFASEPQVAYILAYDLWAVVWRETASIFGQGQLQIRTIDAGDLSLSPTSAVWPSTGSQSEVKLAGDGSETDNDALIVFRDSEIGIRLAQVSITEVGAATLSVYVVTDNLSARMPTISKSVGEYRRVAVAWAEPVAEHGNNRDLFLRSYDSNLISSTPELRLTDSADVDDLYPSIDGNGRDWLLVSEAMPNPGSGNASYRRQRLRYESDQVLFDGPAIEFTDAVYTYRRPEVVYTGLGYVMACFRSSPAGEFVHVVAWGGTGAGGSQSGTHAYPPEGSYDPLCLTSPYAASHVPYVPPTGEAWVTYATNTGIGWLTSIDGSLGLTQVNGGCLYSSTTRTSAPQIGTTLELEYDGDEPGLLTLSSLGYGLADFTCLGCVLVPNSYGPGNFEFVTTDGQGDAANALPIRANPALVGFEAWHQWFVVEPDPGCDLFGVSASRAMKLTVY